MEPAKSGFPNKQHVKIGHRPFIMNKSRLFSTNYLYPWFKKNMTPRIIKWIMVISGFLYMWERVEYTILEKFNSYILPYLDIQINTWLYIFYIALFILLSIRFIQRWKNNYRISNELGFLLFASLYIYIQYRYFSDTYTFSYIAYTIAFTDIILFFISGYLSLFIYGILKQSHIQTSNNQFLIPDHPITEENDDILRYDIEANSIVKTIQTLSLERSWSIGITSSWGTGKTSFLNLIKKKLEKTDSFIIIDFHPRNSSNVQSIQKDFFHTMSTTLSLYNSSIAMMLNNYMEALQLFDEKKVIISIFHLFRTIDNESIKDKIKKVLERLNRKVIIFIEDLDRLNSEEIMEVFKLIDSNASFPNIIFISAYDKNRISQIIEKEDIKNPIPFSDKFFDLETTLPIRPYRYLQEYLINKILEKINISQEESAEYQTTFDSNTYIFSQYLTTTRDVKRFINLFISDYLPIKEEVMFSDMLLLSIIKYKNSTIHRQLYHKKYLQHIGGYYQLQEENEQNSPIPYKDILEKLFPNSRDSEHNSYRKIYSVKAFNIYFEKQLYEELSLKELQKLLHQNERDIKMQIAEWYKNNKINDLWEFLLSRNIFNFNNKEIFSQFIKTIFYLTDKSAPSDIHDTILQFLYSDNAHSLTLHYKFKDLQEYISFIQHLFHPNQTPPYQHKIIGNLIINTLDGVFTNRPILFTKAELLNINKTYLEHYIDKHTIVDETLMSILYSCITDIDTNSRKIILDPDCCKKIKKLIDKKPSSYLKDFVRLKYISSTLLFNAITCEPFWQSIFGGILEFEDFINQEKLDNQMYIERVRNFWTLYKNNNYTPIEIEREWNVQELINDDLRELMKPFNQLSEIQSELQCIIKDKLQTQKEKQEQIHSLLSKVEKIPLHIALKEELLTSTNYN